MNIFPLWILYLILCATIFCEAVKYFLTLNAPLMLVLLGARSGVWHESVQCSKSTVRDIGQTLGDLCSKDASSSLAS